jgi:hypothetical protein
MLAYNFIYIMILLESSREDREVTIPPQEMACNCKLGNVQSLYHANVLVGAVDQERPSGRWMIAPQ